MTSHKKLNLSDKGIEVTFYEEGDGTAKGIRGLLQTLVENDGTTHAMVTSSDGRTLCFKLQQLEAWNEGLTEAIKAARDRLAGLSGATVEMITPEKPLLRVDQTGSLADNVRIHRMATSRFAGQVISTTSSAGYFLHNDDHRKKGTNEDGLLVTETSDRKGVFVAADGMGSAEESRECTAIALEEIQKCPDDIVQALKNAQNRMAGKNGSVGIIVVVAEVGQRPITYRLGDLTFSHDGADGLNKFRTGKGDRLDRFDFDQKAFVPEKPPRHQSVIERIELNAEKWHAAYKGFLYNCVRRQFEDMEPTICRQIALAFIVVQHSDGDKAAFDETYPGAYEILLEKEKREREGIQNELEYVTATPLSELNRLLGNQENADQYEREFYVIMKRILLGKKPAVPKNTLFYRHQNPVVLASLSEHSSIEREIDIVIGPHPIEPGDILKLVSDGWSNNTDEDNLGVHVSVAEDLASVVRAEAGEIEKRMLSAKNNESESIAKAYNPDNATGLFVLVENNPNKTD